MSRWKETYTSHIGVSDIQISCDQYKFDFGISQVTIPAGEEEEEEGPLKGVSSERQWMVIWHTA